ncbi:MAG TPA: gluconeogenesis factor YvcK family protein [Anaerolineales bacterium]|nr:gluconeogenesis factor YvcK family protein [Anaerolineales bacterium]
MRWFAPGLGVKRWFVVLMAGITLIGVGLAILLLDVYRSSPEAWWLPVITFLSLRFLTRPLRILVFGGIGLGLILLGIWGINRSLLVPFLQPGQRIVDQLADYRRRGRGPRVVVIGGGHGIATVLRGLKEYTYNLTAVVSVADDGGSSGELRRNLGILPPGDIRNCLAALSDDEALLTQLFQYRFGGETGLDGHSFGNLFISSLVDITGSFEKAVAESGRVLSVHGQVLPATLHNVRLVADIRLPNAENEVRVEGESQIPKAAGRVRQVWLEPNDASAYPPVIQAILAADMIVIGPGSLYTSILPNILVRDLLEAIHASRAVKFFITNITTQPGETERYTSSDHIQAVEDLVGFELVDVIVSNSCYDGDLGGTVQWVKISETETRDPRVYLADLIDGENAMHHDSAKLAETLMALYNERTGPLTERENTTQPR